MSLTIESVERVPLAENGSGVIHVAGTRVTLDTVAEAFHEGATAEEIVQQYPSLMLADVYSVLGYLLRHQAEVAAYLETRAAQRKTTRRENEERFNPQGVRARLLARRA
ncbi:MAG: DUF433 domain-containing protein [Pedosphaera sp.]|nr:DUF433 domain-containing protein [Pedosphaera sp.]